MRCWIIYPFDSDKEAGAMWRAVRRDVASIKKKKRDCRICVCMYAYVRGVFITIRVRVNYQWKWNYFDDTCLIDSKNWRLALRWNRSMRVNKKRHAQRWFFFKFFVEDSLMQEFIVSRHIARAIADFSFLITHVKAKWQFQRQRYSALILYIEELYLKKYIIHIHIIHIHFLEILDIL